MRRAGQVIAALVLAGACGIIDPPLPGSSPGTGSPDPCLGLRGPVSIVCTGDDGVPVNTFCPGPGRPWTMQYRAHDCGSLGRFT